MLIVNILAYGMAFLLIWLGSGLIVSSVDHFSKKLKLSSFAVSFVFLGLLTSTPEFAVGLTAIADNDPEIFIGNLLGGIPVIFLFVIPLLAILGNGIAIKHDLDGKNLLATLGVILAPSILVLDKRVSNSEGVVLIILYLVLLLLIQKKHGIFDRENSKLMSLRSYSFTDILKILLGIVAVFVASNIIVEKTMYFAEVFQISAFYISLIVLSLGTNLPELSLAVRSVLTGTKDVAFGDYMGSAAVNTLLFGIFTILNNGEVLTINNFVITFIFIASGLLLFFFFSRSRGSISRGEGFILMGLYCLFVVFELFS
jgi:cation:H+ antiporter